MNVAHTKGAAAASVAKALAKCLGTRLTGFRGWQWRAGATHVADQRRKIGSNSNWLPVLWVGMFFFVMQRCVPEFAQLLGRTFGFL